MIFIGFIIVILLIYFLIIRPLTRRNRQQFFDQRGGYYDQRNEYGPLSGGIGGVGSFAGGMAAGALLTYLFEHNRIGYDQFLSLQNLEDHEIMRELMDQNIIQEHEIAQLQEELDRGDDPSNWDENRNNNNPNEDDYDEQENDNSDWDSGGDNNWV